MNKKWVNGLSPLLPSLPFFLFFFPLLFAFFPVKCNTLTETTRLVPFLHLAAQQGQSGLTGLNTTKHPL